MQAYGAVDLLQVKASCVVLGVQDSGVNVFLLMICLSVVQLWMKHKYEVYYQVNLKVLCFY